MKSRGFTLIELMITVAIVAILAAVALPSYRAHFRTNIRSEAQQYLLAVANRQQQFMVDTRAYVTKTTMDTTLPVPSDVSGAYTVSFPDPGTTTFTVTLTPTGDQTKEKCGTLSIDQSGNKTASTTGCW